MRFWRNGAGCCCDEGCGTIRVTVRICGEFANYEGATVTVKDADGNTIGSAVTDGVGPVTVAITEAGTYTIVVDALGRPRNTTTLAATCTANEVIVELDRSYAATVFGCNGRAMPGATVALTRGGATYSGVTDAGGAVEIPLPADGTYAISITAPSPGFAVLEHSVIVGGCGIWGDETLTLDPDENHKCVTWGDRFSGSMLQNGQCLYPWPTTLHLTDALYGPVTLTWYATSPWGDSTDVWYGTKSVTVPACGGCPASGTTLHYFLGRVVVAAGGGTGALSPLAVRSYVDPANGCPGPIDDDGGRVNGVSFEDDAQVSCPPSPVANFTLIGGPLSQSPYCDDTAITITA